jgi:hypothetical protein
VQVTASAPQAAARLLTVCHDVAELLAVMALRKIIPSSRCLHPDCDVAEALQSENFLGFCRPRQDYYEEGEVYGCWSVGGFPTGGCHLLDADNVKPEAHQPVRYVFCRGAMWQVEYHILHGFFGFGIERVIGQVKGVEIRFD